MKNFSFSSHKDFEKIAEIIESENFDVVALQEILSDGKGFKRLLEDYVNRELYNWDFCCANPSDTEDLDKLSSIV